MIRRLKGETVYAANPLDDSKDKQLAADRFMRHSVIGAVTTAIALASTLLGPLPQSTPWLRAGAGVALIVLIYALATLFRTRRADEYLERMWNAGTSAAFVAVIAFTLGQVLLVAAIIATGRDPLRIGWLDLDGAYTLYVALVAFFAAVLIKRFRGA